jgi:hypothetical protein
MQERGTGKWREKGREGNERGFLGAGKMGGGEAEGDFLRRVRDV